MRFGLLLAMVASITLLGTVHSAATPSSGDVLRAIEVVYHDAIRQNTRLQISNQDIDEALLQLLQRQPAAKSEDVVECQPRPHVVSEEELQSKLWSESTRIQTRTSSFTMDRNCVTLHRCSKHGGCCHGQTECSPKKTEVVSIDINIHMWSTGESFVETMQFTNHTECSCQGPIQSCICPSPFVSNLSESKRSCDCQCPTNDHACNLIKAGIISLDWATANHPWRKLPRDSSFRAYKSCLDSGRLGTYHTTGVYCPPIPCESGQQFNVDSLTCESIAAAATNQQLLSSSGTVSSAAASTISSELLRDTNIPQPVTRMADEFQSSTPSREGNSAQTIAISDRSKGLNAANGRKLSIKKKIEQKLRQIQSKGLSSEAYKGRLTRKIIQGLKNLQPKEGRCPSERSSRFKVKSSTFVTCKHVTKTPLVMLDEEDNFLFCSVDIT